MSEKSSYITKPKGYLANGIHCGMKKDGKPDLAFVVSERNASAAGMYTKNTVQGHSLQRTRRIIKRYGHCRAILINTVSANACIGVRGEADAERIAEAAADSIRVRPEEIVTCSTGVIGLRLDVDKIIHGIASFETTLSRSEEAAHRAMHAMMTTDTIAKESSETINLNGTPVTISGMAKGSGMIHPNLATMIAVFTTDAEIDPDFLDTLLRGAVEHTFNRISVDGDTSVCDTVLIMANGMSGQKITPDSESQRLFEKAFQKTAEQLARKIAADGEGATKLIEVLVEEAPTDRDALLIVQSICRSPLCKTAMFGQDANWGRIITAAGYSGANFDPNKTDIFFGPLQVCKNGCAMEFEESEAQKILSNDQILIKLELHSGKASDRMWTCDFSYDYVKINGSYRS